jgi:uroporphyrinogen-III synthase
VLVWITRAKPGAAETAERVAQLGSTPLIAPLTELKPLKPELDLSAAAALAFTSANGVRAFAHLTHERGLPVFTVGEATAEAARAAGFAEVRSADGDVGALAELIAATPCGPVLHPGAAEPAGDLAGALAQKGLPCRSLALYEAVDVEPRDALLRWDEIEAVLVHSPRAARALAALVWDKPAPGMRAFCISPAAAEPLTDVPLESVAFAAFPNEAALLKFIQ